MTRDDEFEKRIDDIAHSKSDAQLTLNAIDKFIVDVNASNLPPRRKTHFLKLAKSLRSEITASAVDQIKVAPAVRSVESAAPIQQRTHHTANDVDRLCPKDWPELMVLDNLPSDFDLSLKDCKEKMVIVLSKISTLRLSNIQDSLIICPRVETSVSIYNAENSVINTISKQLRIHDSEQCRFGVASKSPPIIENCRDLILSAWPFSEEADVRFPAAIGATGGHDHTVMRCLHTVNL